MPAISSGLAGTRQARTMVILLVLLNVADALVTQFLLSQSYGRELNPLMLPFVGGRQFLLLKAAGSSLAALALWDIYRRVPRVGTIAGTASVAFYTAILYWNIMVCFIPEA